MCTANVYPLNLLSPYMHTWIHIHQHYTCTQSGETALHCAVDQEHEDIVDLLLKAKADTDLPVKVICTYIPHTAVMRSWWSLTQSLYTVQNMCPFIWSWSSTLWDCPKQRCTVKPDHKMLAIKKFFTNVTPTVFHTGWCMIVWFGSLYYIGKIDGMLLEQQKIYVDTV